MKKTAILHFYCFFLALTCFAFASEDNANSKIVLQEKFNTNDIPKGWTPLNRDAATMENGSIRFDLPKGEKSDRANIWMDLPVKDLQGTRIRLSIRAKAKDVVKPKNSWHGVRMLLGVDTPGGKRWFQANDLFGDFDWKTIRFNAMIPEGSTGAQLSIGLDKTTGTAWFDDLEIVVMEKIAPKPDRKLLEGRPVYKGHDLPRLRGAMVRPEQFGPEDIKVLAGKWKANHARWHIIWGGFVKSPADTATVAEYESWFDGQCKLIDKMLPEFEKYGVYVCLDIHTPPGGRLPVPGHSAGPMRMFHEQEFQDCFIRIWEKLARRYKNEKMIWSYDLLNEPIEGDIPEGKGILTWRELALKTSKSIRKIDPETAIILEPAPRGEANSLEWFDPFDTKEIPNLVYSVHVYMPHHFTHQGVYREGFPLGVTYPGKVYGIDWNKEELRKALRIPIEYCRDHGVHMYIGEFGAVRWAPDGGASRYLNDCIEIFEEEGWDWAFHSFREWHGWSIEHGSDKNDTQPSSEPTDREQMFRSWFEKNERLKNENVR